MRSGGQFGRKLAYPSSDEMVRRLREMKRKFYREEFKQMIAEKKYDLPLPNRGANLHSVERLSRRRGWAILRRDLRFFLDFCVARLIAWHELRRLEKNIRSKKQSLKRA